MKYRVKGIVEAVQFVAPTTKSEWESIPEGERRKGPAKFYLDTPIEGAEGSILMPGDYICQGEDGHRWRVEAALFEDTYERVP